MLISFRVSNFLSFAEEIEFSMVAGKARQFPNQVIKKTSRNGADLLRAALIYGANASGKSNLVKALDFVRHMVVDGVRAKSSIPRKPFKLDQTYISKPSRFELDIEIKGKLYTYGFILDSKRIHEEWLSEIRSSSEKDLFRRITTPGEENIVTFDIKASKKELNLLELIALGTPPNRLFLHESLERNVKHFTSVYEWFSDSLVIIYPYSKHLLSPFGRGNPSKFGDSLVHYLEEFDTGICGFSLQPVNDPLQEFPEDYFAELEQSIEEGRTVTVWNSLGKRYYIKKEGEQLSISKLQLNHRSENCESNIPFEMDEESDGTLRLLDLIPVLFLNDNENKVFVIDELDRSLHPQLSYEFFINFLKLENKDQLIVTTHELNLLDLDLVRRDEIWFVEKDKNGASSTYSLEEFSPRYDKDIRKGYMLGRFGAIPAISKPRFLADRS